MEYLRKLKILIITLISFAAIVLLVGGYVYYNFKFPENGWNCFLLSMQNCMESLLFNPILPIQDIVVDTEFITSLGSIEQFIMKLYSFAMVLAPFVDILIIYSILDGCLHLFVEFSFKDRRILIVGYNEDVRKLINRKNVNSKVYLWTEKYLSTDEERELYFKKVSVKMNDFSLGDSQEDYQKQIKKFNKYIKDKKIKYILLLNKSDIKNIQYYMTLSSCDVCKEKTIRFFVLNNSFEARNMLQDYFDKQIINNSSPGIDTHMDLRIFNYDQIQAEVLFSELPIFEGVNNSDEKDVHMLIIGGNLLCMYIALHAMNQAVLSSNNKIVIDIVYDNVEYLKELFRKRFDSSMVSQPGKNGNIFEIPSNKIDGLLKIRLSECQIMGDNLTDLLNVLQDEESGRYTYITLCSSVVDENFHVFQCIEAENRKRKLVKDKVPVAMRMSYSEEMKTYLSSFDWIMKKEKEGLLYFMGMDEEYIGLDQIVNPNEEDAIIDYHATYEAVSKAKIYNTDISSEIKRKTYKEMSWNGLEYYKRQANRSLYHYNKVKEDKFDNYGDEIHRFWEQTISDGENDEDLILSNYLIEKGKYPKLLEIAKTEHRRWSYFFISEGWSYADDKQPLYRKHNCLCDWEHLSLNPKTKNILIYDLISSLLLME